MSYSLIDVKYLSSIPATPLDTLYGTSTFIPLDSCAHLVLEKNKFANYPGLAFAAEHTKNHDLHGFYQICM